MVSRRSATRAAAVIAGAYLLVAGVWIVASDWASVVIFGSGNLALIQTFKGLGFVVVTAGILFVTVDILLRRTAAAVERELEVRGRLDRLHQLLGDANALIARADDETELLVAICETAAGTDGFAGAWVATLTEDDQILVVASHHAEALVALESQGAAGCIRDECPVRAVLSGQSRVVENDVFTSATGARLRVAEQMGMRSLAAVPVVRAGKPFAALCVFAGEPDTFGSAEVVLLEQLAADLSIGLERIAAATQRREAMTALERTLTRFTTLIDTSPVPIIAVDSLGIVTVWNTAAEQVFGWSTSEVIGTPDPAVSPEGRQQFLNMLGELRQGVRVAPFQVKRLTKDGRTVEVIVHAAPLISGTGEAEEYVAILLDVTDRVRSERELEGYRQHLEELVEERTHELKMLNDELQEATRVKSEFLASMSHELRTPLNSIIGFSGVLLQGLAGQLGSEQRVQIEMIRRSGDHLLALVNDILDLAKIESGQIDIRPEDFDVVQLVESVTETLRPTADEKRLEFKVNSAFGKVFVCADPVKVQQILFNLVGNALKFTDAGSVEVRISAVADSATVTVVDTGPGIAPEHHELMFDEFHQVPVGRTPKPGGTGLGLTISRQLARLMGGEVSVVSAVGEGSTFILTLPQTSHDDDCHIDER